MDGRTNKMYRTENVGSNVECLIAGKDVGEVKKKILCQLVEQGFDFEKALEKKKGKLVICCYCSSSIHVNDFGGVNKKGVFHKNCFVVEETLKDLNGV